MTIDPKEYKLPKGAWLIVFFLFIVGALNYIDRNMLTTMRSSIIDSIEMSDAQFGLLTSIFLWIYGLFSPFAGFIADKFKRSHVIISSLIIWSAVTWLTGHATTYNQLLISRALMGISEAFYMPAALALIADYHRGQTQSLATGINLTGVMIGSSLGFIGGWIAEKHTWNLAFNGFGVVGIVFAVILLLFLRDAPENNILIEKKTLKKNTVEKVLFSDAIKSLFSQPSFIYILIFWGILGLVNWMIVAWLPTYYKESFNLSQSLAGIYATAYFYPASIIGLLVGGFIADKWSKKNHLAKMITPLIGLAIAAPSILCGSVSTTLILTVTFFFIYGLTSKFTDSNIMPMLCLMVNRKYIATGYGILNMFSTIIGGLGVYVAGVMRDSQTNLSFIYLISGFAIIGCIGLLCLAIKSIKQEKNNRI